MAEAQLV